METENLTIEETKQTETPVEETAPTQPAEVAEQEELLEQEAAPEEQPPKPVFYKTARFWELAVGGLTVLCILLFIILLLGFQGDSQ